MRGVVSSRAGLRGARTPAASNLPFCVADQDGALVGSLATLPRNRLLSRASVAVKNRFITLTYTQTSTHPRDLAICSMLQHGRIQYTSFSVCVLSSTLSDPPAFEDAICESL